MENLLNKIERYEAFFAADSANKKLAANLIDLYMRAGQLDKAKSQLESAVEHWPEESEFIFQQGMLCLYLNQYLAAIDSFSQLYSASIPQDVVRYNVAWAQMGLGQADEALGTLEEMSGLTSRAQLLKGRALHSLGRFSEAEALVLPLLNEDELSVEVESMLITIALDSENTELAQERAEKLIERCPDNLEANVTLGVVELETGKLSKADSYFEVALSTKPDSGRAHLGCGLAAMLRQDLNKAIYHLKKAVSEMPSHLGTYNALSWCYIFQQDLKQAKTIALEVKNLNPKFAESQGTLAIISVLQGDKQEAKRFTKLANRLNPASFSGQFAASLLAHDAGDEETSKKIVRNLLDTNMKKDGGSLSDALKRFNLPN
ncbi:tetratricopeptide repeat protein [Microbulbifer sp. TRSA002]|uniref:tetratricopeptide repeat protein n=1 Tax=Microbulbifer sp. TRSA002 TaxID=3243382 RepID=UPI00403A572C